MGRNEMKNSDFFLRKYIFVVLIPIFLYTNVVALEWSEASKIVASERGSSDEFGKSVAIFGDYAIVGAWHEDEDEENTLSRPGSAYIFKKNSTKWEFLQKIVAPDRAAEDMFGFAVAMSDNYAVIGAYGEEEDANGLNTESSCGSAYIFARSGTTWSFLQKIVPSDRVYNEGGGGSFGWSVGISGEYIIVGAKSQIYYVDGSPDYSAGAAYIFKNSAGIWEQEEKIVATNREGGDVFGDSVSISGDYAVVGSYFDGEDASENNPLSSSGSAYIFVRNGTAWSLATKIVASDRADHASFGYAVAISGEYIIVGANGEDLDALGENHEGNAGAAYLFKNTLGTWQEVQKIVASNRYAGNNFGRAVSISGDYAIVGAPFHYGGSVYIFKNTANIWTEKQAIVGSDTALNDYFGSSVSISGKSAIVGAYGDDVASTPEDPAKYTAGAAYVFENMIVFNPALIQYLLD